MTWTGGLGGVTQVEQTHPLGLTTACLSLSSCSPGAYLLLIPSSSRRLQMTSTAAALASEPAPPGNPETPPAPSQRYSWSKSLSKSLFACLFCQPVTFIVLFQSSMSQLQLRACWSWFPGICIVPATRAPKSVWYAAKSKPTVLLLQCVGMGRILTGWTLAR